MGNELRAKRMGTELRGRIALVTGSSRGVGRGIAHELGAAGATVFVTGRSRSGEPTTDDLPGTVEGTARRVDEAGGEGLPAACDHADDAAVEALARRIREERGRLDLLVNSWFSGWNELSSMIAIVAPG